MAISSSSGSNSIGHSSSPTSSPSSSDLSASSLDSILESREPTPEYNSTAAHGAIAPLHWDAEEFNFGVVSEEDKSETEGEDLRLLFQEESVSSNDNKFSWDGVNSSSEKEIDSSSGDDEPMGGKPSQFLGSSKEDSEEGNSGGVDGWSHFGSESSSSDDDDDDDSDDGGDAPARSPKRRRYLAPTSSRSSTVGVGS